jgi:hypothetical protein
MSERPGNPSAAERRHAQEQAWLEENVALLWPAAYTGYLETGRGTLIIDTTAQPLPEEPPFRYAAPPQPTEADDETLKLLAQYVAEYDPERQLVATFLHAENELPAFSLYQLEVDQYLADVMQAITVANQVPEQEPPDIETLMAWEAEGGCEATDGCWVEPDGCCSHGNQSWLLELGLI